MVDYTQRNRDEDFEYSESVSEAKLNRLKRITKSKYLYEAPDISSTKLREVTQFRIVEQIETPVTKSLRSWIKIKVTIEGEPQEGWINTKESLNENLEVIHENPGVIMKNTPVVEDIEQHMFGNCSLLSALLSLTRKYPDYIRNSLFITNPEEPLDRHTVRFFAPQQWVDGQPTEFIENKVTVNNTVLKTTKSTVSNSSNKIIEPGNYGSRGNQPWPAIVEKAFAAWPRKDQNDNLQGGQSYRAAMYLMGQNYVNLHVQLDNLPAEEQQNELDKNKRSIIAAINETGIITAGTLQSVPKKWKINNPDQEDGPLKWGGIAFKHEYEVVQADNNNLRLRNPYGRYSRVRGKVEEDRAESVLSWKEFFTVCSHVSLRKNENW